MANNKNLKTGLIAIILFILIVALSLAYYKYSDRFNFLQLGKKSGSQLVTGDFDPKIISPLLKEKKYDEARNILENYKKKGVVTPELYRLLYVVNMYIGDNTAALEAIKVYVQLNSSLSKYWVEYITLEINKGTNKTVIDEIYKRAFEGVRANKSKMELVNMYTNYSSFLRGYNDFTGAIKYLELAKELNLAQANFYDDEIRFIKEEQLKNNIPF